MKQITISTAFQQAILKVARELVLKEKTEAEFVDDRNKKYDGMKIFIDQKPSSLLFTFSFPEDFAEGKGKKVYVGNN